MQAQQTEAEKVYQDAASFSDAFFSEHLEGILRVTGAPPGAVLSGALVACCRFIVDHMLVAPVIPTVRNVLQVLIKSGNEAAEAMLERQDKQLN